MAYENFFAWRIKTGLLIFFYFAFTLVLSTSYSSVFNITFLNKDTMYIIGLILMIIGVSINGVSSGKLVKGFTEGKIVKEGPYLICTNPILASFIFISIPGIGLMLGSWLILTALPVGFLIHKIFARRDESYLIALLGQEYVEYRKSVLIKFI